MEIEKATCCDCGYEMEAVRPGKHQCNHCEEVKYLEEQWEKSRDLAGELIAMIRINVLCEKFNGITIEQVDEHLKPWIERLKNLTLKSR